MLRRHTDLVSRLVDPRNVDIWLPPSYTHHRSAARYPIVYMHDGQNLFDANASFIGVDWGVHQTVLRLISEKRAREAIVVGIWNTPKRIPEYLPQKPFERLLGPMAQDELRQAYGDPISDDYLGFIVGELKPMIDSTYRTLPDRENTFIMGSSMGGLVSAYAICEYPEVFCGAGCLSTHWPVGDGIVIDYLKTALPDPATHKLYFDYGTETLDAAYEPYQIKADAVMKAAGYVNGENWITRKFPGEEHSERAWRKRVEVPLEFLLRED